MTGQVECLESSNEPQIGNRPETIFSANTPFVNHACAPTPELRMLDARNRGESAIPLHEAERFEDPKMRGRLGGVG